jgi:type II secretory pathway component PulM
MSVASLFNDLAAAVRDKLNQMTPKLVPSGGTTGQALVKTSATNHDLSWATLGGGGGSVEVYIQQTEPTEAGPLVWWQTNGSDEIINMTLKW